MALGHMYRLSSFLKRLATGAIPLATTRRRFSLKTWTIVLLACITVYVCLPVQNIHELEPYKSCEQISRGKVKPTQNIHLNFSLVIFIQSDPLDL